MDQNKKESLKVESFITKKKTFTEHLLCARKSDEFHGLL